MRKAVKISVVFVIIVTKDDTDKYSGMEDLGDGWQISWKIMGLT